MSNNIINGSVFFFPTKLWFKIISFQLKEIKKQFQKKFKFKSNYV